MKEKLREILLQLVESTINGSIVWEKRDSLFAGDKCYPFRAFSIDKDTWFDIEIRLKDNMSLDKGHLWIYNKGLVDGKILLISHEYPEISKIEVFVYNNIVKPNIIVKDQEEVLGRILSGIGDKQYVRDKKIGEILSDVNPFKKLW